MAATPDPTRPAAPKQSEYRAQGEALRHWGQTHALVHDLIERLPRIPGTLRKPLTNGLYVEAEPGPWVVVKGQLRVSLLRVHSVTPEGKQLVGQVHATQPAGGHGAPLLRFYLHDAEVVVVRESRDADEWWLGLLDRHYALGGVPLECDTGVRA